MPRSTKVLASLRSDYYSGEPDVTLHKKGTGRVVHSALFNPQNVSALLARWRLKIARDMGGHSRRNFRLRFETMAPKGIFSFELHTVQRRRES